MQKRCLRRSLKLVDEKCTRMYIFHQGRFTPFVWALGTRDQPQAKIVVAVVGIVVVPIRTSGVVCIVVPAAAAFDTVRTGSSTLLMSLPFNTLHYQWPNYTFRHLFTCCFSFLFPFVRQGTTTAIKIHAKIAPLKQIQCTMEHFLKHRKFP